MLTFTFYAGNSNEPEKKRVELNLKGSAQSWWKDLAVVSGSYFNTNTGLFRRAERGFQAVTDSGRSCSTSQTEKPGDGSCELDLGWLYSARALWLKTTQKGYWEQCVMELRCPVLVLLHISRSTHKKRRADPFYGSILLQNTTPKQKRTF